MLTPLILLLVLAGIVVVSRRWPDVEARLWPGQGVIPKRETAEPAEHQHRPEHHHPHAAHHAHPAPAAPKHQHPTPRPETVSKSAVGRVMRTKPISSEPDVSPAVLDATQSEPAAESVVEQATPPAAPAPGPAPAEPDDSSTPGERVTGAPARPSQPAYYDATSGVTENIDDLETEADQAYRDRDYERAEQACLKILVQQPKNHKYMTRIGQIYQEMGNLEDAKEAFESAKKLDPKNFFVLNRLTEVERMLKDKGGRTKAKAKKQPKK